MGGDTGANTGAFDRVAQRAAWLSHWLGRAVEVIVVILMVILVLMVWLGVLVRYFDFLSDFNITFTEEASRYLMIWMALLAVSIGIARREHIGVLFLFDRFPPPMRRVLLAALDMLAIAFFCFLFYYGVPFATGGFKQFTMIYQMPKAVPFFAVPVATALAVIQLVLVAIRDQAAMRPEPAAPEVEY